jgi:serine/threonine-protein kinase RsbW
VIEPSPESGAIIGASTAAPGAGSPPGLLDETFTQDQLTTLRHRVQEASRRCGLSPERLANWVTAVNELTTNAVRHGHGPGHLRLRFDGRLTCEVRDRGPGFDIQDHLDRTDRPALSARGGMGLWIVAQMAELLSVASGPTGTIICIAPAP